MVRDVKRQLDASFFKAAPGTTPDGPSGLGSLTTAVASNGGTLVQPRCFRGGKGQRRNPVHHGHRVRRRTRQPCWRLSTIKAFASRGLEYAAPAIGSDRSQCRGRSAVSRCTRHLLWRPIRCGLCLPNGCCSWCGRMRGSSPTLSVMFTSDRVAIRTTMRVSLRIHPTDGDHENHEGVTMVKRQVQQGLAELPGCRRSVAACTRW